MKHGTVPSDAKQQGLVRAVFNWTDARVTKVRGGKVIREGLENGVNVLFNARDVIFCWFYHSKSAVLDKIQRIIIIYSTILEYGLVFEFRPRSVVSQTSQHDLSQYWGVVKRAPDCVYFPRLHSTQRSFFETRRRQRYVDRGMRKKQSIAFPSQRGSEG